jgi:hypothetical protein
VKALKKMNELPSTLRHFNLRLCESIVALAVTLYGSAELVLPGYKCYPKEPVLLRHGLHFALEQQKIQMQKRAGVDSAPASAQSGESSATWLERMLAMPHNVKLRRCTAVDIQKLLASVPQKKGTILDDPTALSSLALSQGLLLFIDSCTKLARRVILDAAAWDTLSKHRYPQLQSQLRAVSGGAPIVAERVVSVEVIELGSGVNTHRLEQRIELDSDSNRNGESTVVASVDSEADARRKEKARLKKAAQREKARAIEISPAEQARKREAERVAKEEQRKTKKAKQLLAESSM